MIELKHKLNIIVSKTQTDTVTTTKILNINVLSISQ